MRGNVKQIWHVAREITISLSTICIGSNIIFCLVRVFFSIDMLRSGTNPVIVLQPFNPIVKLGCFHHLKQRSKTKIDNKRILERCDGNTKIVFVKAKKAKSVTDMAELEIDRLD